MGVIDKQILLSFKDKEPKEEVIQTWPKGSRFRKLILQPEGIYTYFEVPNVMSVDKEGLLESEEWKFAIIFPGASTQDGDDFIDILTAYSEVPPAQLKEEGLPSDYQAVVIFTVYLRKRPTLIKLL